MLAGRSAFQPPFEGGLRFAGAATSQKSLDADVLVEIRPVYTLAVADEAPV